MAYDWILNSDRPRFRYSGSRHDYGGTIHKAETMLILRNLLFAVSSSFNTIFRGGAQPRLRLKLGPQEEGAGG